jgi:hypothetical protein
MALEKEPVRCVRTPGSDATSPDSSHKFLMSERLQNEFPNAISLYAPTAAELMEPKWG